MANQSTYIVQRTTIRRILIAMHVDEKSIGVLLSEMEKNHRHINAITLVSQLEKIGIEREQISNILRRIGFDDLTIAEVFEMTDVQKISAEIGRVYSIEVDFS
ncbi:MAG: hypothetical protein ACP5TL_00685 [Candidatus Micrarchaeia archaeon]